MSGVTNTDQQTNKTKNSLTNLKTDFQPLGSEWSGGRWVSED